MKHLKKYKLFEHNVPAWSQEDLVSDVRDILADVSEKERVQLVIDDNSIIIGVGDDDNLFSTWEESTLRDLSLYIDDLSHLDSYLQSKGFEFENVAIWDKSISHSYYDKSMKYDFESLVSFISKRKVVYIDIMYKRK